MEQYNGSSRGKKKERRKEQGSVTTAAKPFKEAS